MSTQRTDKNFAGSIPRVYETYLVPLIFNPYAVDLANRAASRSPARVLEVAAGTGVVTRHLARLLPPDAAIVATDLNQAMLDHASTLGIERPVEWRRVDAMELPFDEGSFDVVVCQFGAMFFPDRARAFAEARRVLRPGGAFMFNVWDRIEENEFADTVTRALEPLFPDKPPRFLARTPYGYHDPDAVERDLAAAGFSSKATITTHSQRSRAASPHVPAVAFCEGTPLRNEIEAHGPSALEHATTAATQAIAHRFGSDAVDGKIRAHVVTIER
jgi:SAM-dependent methyltransferase